MLRYLQPTFLRHAELVVAQQERPDLLPDRSSHTPKIHKPVDLLLLIGLNIRSHTQFSVSACSERLSASIPICVQPYRAVLEDLLPDLQRKASLSLTGNIRIHDGGVDQSGKVSPDCGQVAAVS